MKNRQNWKIGQVYGIFKISPSRYPKPRYPSHANSRDKESLNSSTQAKPQPEELSMRSSLRSSTGKVQQCSLTQ